MKAILLITLLFTITVSSASQYKPNGDITLSTLSEWQTTTNWVKLDGGSGYPITNDEIIFSTNAKLTIDFDLVNENIQVYLSFGDDGQLTLNTNANLYVLGSITMSSSNPELKVFGTLEVENNFNLDNGNLFIKDGGIFTVNGNFIRSDIGSGQLEIGGVGTEFHVAGDFNDQHYTPSVYSNPLIDIVGSCATKQGSFCDMNLPVELISLEVSVTTKGNEISWSTASEINNSHFEIYSSFNNKEWIKIGELEGYGNSSVQINYTFIDTNSLSLGKNTYYKLIQFDFDGKSESYGPLKVNNNGEQDQTIQVYPTDLSSGEDLYIQRSLLNNQSIRVTIIDSQGKVVISYKESSINNKGAISNKYFTRGMNIVVIEEGKETYTFKILK
ncbi:T9SS type A sorting domain-containing protein [Flammeovirga pectinis]|nr:T9SS type A sorting domain-containing protein [Flammeovirga pectinis]